MNIGDDVHFGQVVRRLADGRVVPFLGAGASLCDRPERTLWEAGSFVPSGRELARALAERSQYPDPDEPDLMWVTQYLVAVMGERSLYRVLHDVFSADYAPTSLHRVLAGLPELLRERAESSWSS